MNADEAAELTAALQPSLAIPHHCAFTGGPLGDRLMTKADRDPGHFVQAARRLAPGIPVQVISPGEPATVNPR